MASLAIGVVVLGPRLAWTATLTVCASGCAYADVQGAVNAAQPGDTILLRAGETFVGHIELPAKSSPSGAYIVIRSDAPDSAFPPAGTRLVPAGRAGANVSASALPRLRGRGGQWKTTPVISAAPGAHHYRLQFLEVDGLAQVGWGTLVGVGTNVPSVQSTLASVPYAIVFDRTYIHGHPTKGQIRCVSLNGRDLHLLNSYVADCATWGLDSQAVAGYNGPGPFKIINNYLEGAGENVMFGGADPAIDNLVPSDIEIRRNHFVKPLKWRQPILATPSSPSASASGSGSLSAGTHYFKVVAVMDSHGATAVSGPSAERAVSVASGSAVRLSWGAVNGADRYRIYRGTAAGSQNRFLETSTAVTSFTYTGTSEGSATPPSAGTRWTVKNLLELKNAQRVIIDGNLFEQSWHEAQKGFAMVMTPRNQGGTAPWSVVRDLTITNNIIRHTAGGIVLLGTDYNHQSGRMERVSIRNNLFYDMSYDWGPYGHFLLITQSPRDVTVDHNTIFLDDKIVLIDDGPVNGFVYTNNIAPHNRYGIFGSGVGVGNPTLDTYFPGSIVRRNVFGGGPADRYPPDNFFPDMPTFLAHFVSAAADDYRLVSSSSFRGAGTDGRDLGVDFAALAAAQGGTSPGGGGGSSGSTPYGGTPVSLPGTIQAENFDEGSRDVAYHDTTSGNSGGRYRSTDVDIEATSDTGGGYDVGWMSPSEWLKYTVNVSTAGTYDIEARVAALGAGGTFHIEANGVDKTGPVTIPNTGGWQNWVTVRRTGVSLSAGQQVWRLVVDAAGNTGVVGNVNFLRAVASGGSGGGNSTPYTGTPVALPGTIQAENFDNGGASVAYHDTSVGNSGGRYRSTDVDIEATADSGGGYNVGWMSVGEWLKYSVTVGATATYDLEFRVASSGGGGRFHLEVNGVDRTGPLTIPDTRGWQTWTTVRRAGVSLSAGPQVWRLVIDAAGSTGSTANLNYIRAVGGSGTPPPGGDIVLHAADVTNIAGNWTRGSYSSGAGGQAMRSADRGWSTADVPRAAPADYFEAQFSPEANRAYRIWLRMRGTSDSKWNESVWVQFSGAETSGGAALWRIGTTSALLVNLEDCAGCGVAAWGWQDHAYWSQQSAIVRFPTATPQTIRIQTREDGVIVDQIVLSPSTYFDERPGAVRNDTTILTRTSDGGDDSPTEPAGSDVVLYARDVSRFSGNWSRRAAAGAAGGELVHSDDRGWNATDAPYSAPYHYFEMPFTPEAGRAYRVWLRLRAVADSKWNESVWVQFSGSVSGSGAPVWRIGSNSALLVNLEDCSNCGVSGWGWQDNAYWLGESAIVRFAAATPQTIRVQAREDGVEIDQIVLSPVTYFDSAPGRTTGDNTIVSK